MKMVKKVMASVVWFCGLAKIEHTYMPTVIAVPYLLRKIIKINRAFQKYGKPLKSSGFSRT